MKWRRNRVTGHAKDSPPLDARRIAWLMAVAACALLPHASHLPGWLDAVATLLFTWRVAQLQLQPRWPGVSGPVKLLVVVACCAGVTLTFGHLFGREPGVALLTLLLVLKLHELRSGRDGHAVVLLGYFMLLAAFLHSQTPAMAAILALSMIVITAALIALTGPPAPVRTLLRQSSWMLTQALPFMLVLFVLFPRVPGPLWGLPLDAYGSTSGLSDNMAPGSISKLGLSGEIAFRVRFTSGAPAARELYWRGPVMSRFDGKTWRQGDSARRFSDQPLPPGNAVTYEVTLEPNNRNWLFALETVSALPAGTRLSDDGQVLSGEVVRSRRRDRFESVLATRPGGEERSAYLQAALQLPPAGNQRARELAHRLRTQAGSPDATVDAALQLFRREPFVYTLKPPLLGSDGIDEFLFDTRRGFCEHYAGAFVFLMRAAGVPSRVVTGYQGGERNNIDDYLVVRQSDAHAWAEVWLHGEGWRRVDPTAAILPSRVERGLADMAAGEPVPFVARVDTSWLRALRHRWEATNNAWNQWVLSYDQQKQRELLSQLGMKTPNWRTMTIWMASLCALLALALTAWTLRRTSTDDSLARAWRALRGSGLSREPWEGPMDYAARIASVRPDLANEVSRACRLYADARYGNAPHAPAVRELRASARALRRKRMPPTS